MVLKLPVWVEEKANEVLEQLEPESIAVYLFLSDRFNAKDPVKDDIFQFVFRSFYRLDNAGLTSLFKRRFFELMSHARSVGASDISAIVTDLWGIRNLKNQQSIQFSFATKLAATITPNVPIYDAEVASIFGFTRPYHGKTFEKRLEEYLGFHSSLKATYQGIIEEDTFKGVRKQFRAKFGCSEAEVSEYKALDFIFWAGGRYQRKSKVA